MSNRKTIDRIATENQIELSNQKKIKAGRAITRIIDIWDPPHFIFELLQNADDAKASIVNYYVGDNGIIFTHNGTDFEENQVEAICSIGESTKKIITQIGFMGMGFKSVFKITDNPQIISEKFRFYFSKDGYSSDDDGWVFIPKWLEIIPDDIKFAIKDGFTHIILPFKSDLEQETKDDIRTFLNKIEPISIAFLNNIMNLNIYFNKNLKLSFHKNGSSIIVEKNYEKNIILFKSRTKEILIPENLKKSNQVKKKGRDKAENVSVTLAFLFYENGKFITKEQPFYAFLPTEENTYLKFILQTDFILNSKRSSLDKEILKWNAWLIEGSQPILWEAIEEFKSNQVLKYDFYSILPSQSNNSLVKNHFILPFIKECRNKDFILTMDEQWKKPDEVIWAEPDFQNLVTLSDLLKVTKSTDGKQRYYIHQKFKIETSLRKELGITEFDESKEYSTILELIKDEEWLKSKTSDWFNSFYKFLFDRLLNEQGKRWKDNNIWTKKEEISKQKIVRDTKGLLQKPIDVLFKPADENLDTIYDIPGIHLTDIAESSNSGKLLKQLRVENFNSETIIKKILSGYENGKWNDWTQSEKTGGNKFIEAWLIKNKMEIPTNSTIKKEKLSSIRLFCENGNPEKANECYIANDDLRKILPTASFLSNSEEYSVEFLKFIGVEPKPRLIKKGNHNSSEKNVTLRWEEYCNWLMSNERVNLSSDKVEVFSLDGFDTLIDSANKELIQIYLRYLINNWKDYKEYIKCKCYYPERFISSYFAFQLKQSAWLPSKDDLVKPMKTVFVPNRQIKHLGKDLLIYVDVDEKLIEKGTDFFMDIGLSSDFTIDILVSLLNDIKKRIEKETQGIISGQLNAQLEEIKEVISSIYEEIYHKTKSEENLYYEKYSKDLYLLSTNNKFISVNNLFWDDDFKLGKIFKNEVSVHFVWIPDNINYQSDLFRFFKIKKLSDKIIKRVDDPVEKTFDSNLTRKLMNKSIYFKRLLFSYKKDDKCLGFFERVKVYNVNEMKKIYSLNSIEKTILNDPVSCDISKGIIYIKKGSNNSDLAFELTSVFKIDKSNAPLIEDILEKSDKNLDDIFQEMNFPKIGAVPSKHNGDEDIIQEKEKKESVDIGSETNTSDEGEMESEIDDESTGGEGEADLVDPSKLKEKNRKTLKNEPREKHTDLYDGEIADDSDEPKHTVKPKSASDPKNKTEISKLEVERIAREIVVRFEKKAGRDAKDCSGNKCGYDIISYDGNSERYIEIKGSKNDYPSFSISGNEWHAAEDLKDKYYIYRVAYIKRSPNHTTITIIKNPAEQLATTRKEIIEIKDWHKAFEEAETVEFEEENENNGA